MTLHADTVMTTAPRICVRAIMSNLHAYRKVPTFPITSRA